MSRNARPRASSPHHRGRECARERPSHREGRDTWGHAVARGCRAEVASLQVGCPTSSALLRVLGSTAERERRRTRATRSHEAEGRKNHVENVFFWGGGGSYSIHCSYIISLVFGPCVQGSSYSREKKNSRFSYSSPYLQTSTFLLYELSMLWPRQNPIPIHPVSS